MLCRWGRYKSNKQIWFFWEPAGCPWSVPRCWFRATYLFKIHTSMKFWARLGTLRQLCSQVLAALRARHFHKLSDPSVPKALKKLWISWGPVRGHRPSCAYATPVSKVTWGNQRNTVVFRTCSPPSCQTHQKWGANFNPIISPFQTHCHTIKTHSKTHTPLNPLIRFFRHRFGGWVWWVRPV